MGIEYELKFRATEPQLSAIEQAFPGQWQTLSMETTYFDTPAGALSARRYTLRRRLENGVSVCTLKTPAREQGRQEWEITCETIGDALPRLSRLSGILLPPEEALVPICGARFTRQARLLTLPACAVELALDRGVLIGGGREIPLCEVELELKSGSRERLDAYGQQFKATFELEKERVSKFRRALALAIGEQNV